MNIFDGANILRITVVSGQGVKSYAVGDRVNGKTIDNIILQHMRVGDDEIHYYCGIANTHIQPLVFSISINSPHEIEYV